MAGGKGRRRAIARGALADRLNVINYRFPGMKAGEEVSLLSGEGKGGKKGGSNTRRDEFWGRGWKNGRLKSHLGFGFVVLCRFSSFAQFSLLFRDIGTLVCSARAVRRLFSFCIDCREVAGTLEGERRFRLSVVVIRGFVRVTQRTVTFSGEPRALPSFFFCAFYLLF